MALVNYGSSDEEEDDPTDIQSTITNHAPTTSQHDDLKGAKLENGTNGQQVAATNPIEQSAVNEGPVIGPMIPIDAPVSGLLEEDPEAMLQSPYSANRALLRDLTLPTLPNYDIPPSPPGSPAESSNSKFKHFLQLKKQGIHFNEKLAKSPALRNPSLMEKLMDFADIDETEQYHTTLPVELWNPGGFPKYAYKGELLRSQQKLLKTKEEEKLRGQRESVDFVPAGAGDSSSRSGTPGVGSRGGQKSAAERIMAGLDRGRSNSPQVQGVQRKSRFES